MLTSGKPTGTLPVKNSTTNSFTVNTIVSHFLLHGRTVVWRGHVVYMLHYRGLERSVTAVGVAETVMAAKEKMQEKM